MNELEQLKNVLPMIHRDKKYKELAVSIENAVSEGRTLVNMEFDFEIDDRAIDALNAANIDVSQAIEGSYEFRF